LFRSTREGCNCIHSLAFPERTVDTTELAWHRAIDICDQKFVMRNAFCIGLLSKVFVIVVLVIWSWVTVSAQQRESYPHSMKGYEIYSWSSRGQWYFSLVIGTNRQKTFQGIASDRSRVKGLAALKGRLDLLPAGEDVFWSDCRIPQTSLRQKNIVDEIIAHCRIRQLNLRVS
jgi:hypothetical protein